MQQELNAFKVRTILYTCTLISLALPALECAYSITVARTSCQTEGQITMVNLEYEGYLNFLTGDQINITGQVGVCNNGFYDSVCDVNWDANDAAVLCRSIIPGKLSQCLHCFR